MPYTDNKRIPELIYNGLLPSNGKFAWYDPATDTTYHVNAQDFAVTAVSPDDAWNDAFVYSEGDIVSYNGEVWVSESDDNEGNPPGPESIYWTIGVRGVDDGEFVEVDTSGATITLDMELLTDRSFFGSVDIDEVKTWEIVNALPGANKKSEFLFIINMVAPLSAQTLPATVKMTGIEFDSDSKAWTPYDPGEWHIKGVLLNGVWRLQSFGPFN